MAGEYRMALADLRQKARDLAYVAVQFAIAAIKARYNSKHKRVNFKVEDYVHLKLYKGYRLNEHANRKLSH